LEQFTGDVMERQLEWLVPPNEDEAQKLQLDKECAQTRDDLVRARKWRDWMRRHDGVLPKQRPNPNVGTLEHQRGEKTIKQEMDRWKVMTNHGEKQRNRNLYVLVMRHFGAFADFLVPLRQLTLHRNEQVNELLRQGFGTESERKEYVSSSGEVFPALELKPFPRNGPDGKKSTYYGAWNDYLLGARRASQEVLLTGLPSYRAAKARAIHLDNYEARMQSIASSYSRRLEKQYASGIVQKNRNGKRTLEDPRDVNSVDGVM
jgi:hypothetical protein